MNFDLNEEQELFRATVERFTAPVDTEWRRKLRVNEGGYDRARWSELAELGLIALAASEERGGMGGTPLDLAIVGEALGRGIAPDPWLENGVLPARLLACAGADDSLEAVLSGETFVAFAGMERGQRYSVIPKHTKFQTRGEKTALSGEKTFVMGGAIADAFIVVADKSDQLAFFLVPADREGVKARAYRLADGSMACELMLAQVEVTDADRLDIETGDFTLAIADVRLLASAEMVGLGQRLLDDTLRYVKEREQFGVPIGSFQALQHRLVDCYAAIEQSRSMLYRAALGDRSDAAAWQAAAAGAKVFISEHVDMVAREAVQMHGGMGVTDELSIGHAMKRALLLSRLFGDADSTLAEYAEAA